MQLIKPITTVDHYYKGIHLQKILVSSGHYFLTDDFEKSFVTTSFCQKKLKFFLKLL
jgi:hypothetical protein